MMMQERNGKLKAMKAKEKIHENLKEKYI